MNIGSDQFWDDNVKATTIGDQLSSISLLLKVPKDNKGDLMKNLIFIPICLKQVSF